MFSNSNEEPPKKKKLAPYHPNARTIKTTSDFAHRVFIDYTQKRDRPISEWDRMAIRRVDFSNWGYADYELMLFLRQMFRDLEFFTKFDISDNVFDNFLFEVYRNYNQVPFHNFKHCFMVTQMCYTLTWINELLDKFPAVDILGLLIAAIFHDLDHPGLSNYYHRSANTELNERSPGGSPLEIHHISVGFSILKDPKCNILAALNQKDLSRVKYLIELLILSTDMGKHHIILAEFDQLGTEIDYSDTQQRDIILKVFLKASDISNEVRPFATADRWVDALLREFFYEAEEEKKQEIKVLDLMNADAFYKPGSQVFFIKTFGIPMAQLLARVFPKMKEEFLEAITKQYDTYEKLCES